jgi:hypothetical protein
MDDDRPDELQTLWLVRGTLSLVVGAIVLIVAVFDSSDRPFSLLVAFAGLGFGTSDVWMAVSSMADDKARRLSSPARVESAERGLETAGWAGRSTNESKDADLDP